MHYARAPPVRPLRIRLRCTLRRIGDCATAGLCSVVSRFPHPQHIQARAHPSRFSRIAASRERSPPPQGTRRHVEAPISDGFATGCMRTGSLRVACARATPDATSTSEHEHIQHGIEADPQNRGEPRALPPLSDEPQPQHSESSTTSKTSSANSSTNATGAGLATFSNGPSFGANA